MLDTVAAATGSVALAFTSLNNETDLAALPVQGNLPTWLNGVLYRNGPAKFETPVRTFNHWFDGLAMIHRYEFKNGQVSYRNRFLRTTPYRQMVEQGQFGSGFEYIQPGSITSRIFNATLDILGRKNRQTFNTNVNVIELAGKMMALTEQPVPTVFEAETLETQGAFYFKDTLFG